MRKLLFLAEPFALTVDVNKMVVAIVNYFSSVNNTLHTNFVKYFSLVKQQTVFLICQSITTPPTTTFTE